MKPMVMRTMEGFIRKLESDGLSEYARELRCILAMSRRRRDALTALSNMTITLLTHLVKYIALPRSRDRHKWRGEIRGYLSAFNIRNKRPRGKPWISAEEVKRDLNDVLSTPGFRKHMARHLESYPERDRVLRFLSGKVRIRDLGVGLSFSDDCDLEVVIDERVL